MWKFVTRGIRESLERRACRTNVYSQSSQDGSGNNDSEPVNSLAKCDNKLGAPCFSAFYHGYARGRGTTQLGDRDSNRKRNNDAHDWTEAVGWAGWSSVLALGYVVCQSLCIRRKLFEVDGTNLDKWKKTLIIQPHVQATQLLSHFLLPKPQHILPISKQIINQESCESIKNSEDLVDCAIDIEKECEQEKDPITAKKALNEAMDEFSQAHEMVLAELEFTHGLEAIKEKRYEDAVEHFNTGAKMSSPGSMFNLGLCYELGLGTSKDYVEAAKYYKKAAEIGHADAMYNLGVYHAQGKGDVNIDLNVARYWFKQAANNGKIEAIKALQLEQTFKKQTDIKHKTSSPLKIKTMQNIQDMEQNSVTKFISYNSSFDSNIYSESIGSDEYTNSYDEDLDPPTPTEIFLDMLGVKHENVIPLISDGH